MRHLRFYKGNVCYPCSAPGIRWLQAKNLNSDFAGSESVRGRWGGAPLDLDAVARGSGAAAKGGRDFAIGLMPFAKMSENHLAKARAVWYTVEAIKEETMWEYDEEWTARERQKAKELKKSRWWQNLIQKTTCYYCQTPISRSEVTMDHVVPISRGGRSTAGNLVPACKSCNERKRSLTPMEWQDYMQDFKRNPTDNAASSKPEPPEMQ